MLSVPVSPERRCVYTVLVGGYEDLVEQPMAEESALDFLCFTDDASLQSQTWDIEVIDPLLSADPARSSRLPKIMAHDFVSQYEASLYIDNSVRLTRPPESIFEDLLGRGVGIAALRHPYRETVADEFVAVMAAGYDTPSVCEEQRHHYRSNFPGSLDLKPLIGGFLLRRHLDLDVVAAMRLWWYHVLRFSRRDQLSLPLVLSQSAAAVAALDVDIRDNQYCEWPVGANRRRPPFRAEA